MTVTARSLTAALVDAVGRERLDEAPAFAVDGVSPRWVARPATVEQVAAVLAVACEEGLAVMPRGSGSAVDLGRPPARIDVVLDLTDLHQVLEDSPGDLTVSVQAGLTAGALAARLGTRRQHLPIDPPGWASRTLGGLAATGAWGPLRARHGTIRDLVLGVRFVQADGVVTWGGAKVVKSVTGYDVPKLMVGSLGTLGVLVEMTLRLHPLPESEGTWLVRFADRPAAQDFVAALIDSTIRPRRVEYLDESALRACAVDPAPVAIAIAIGSVDAAVRGQGDEVERLAVAAGAVVAEAAPDFWTAYDRALARGEGETVVQVASLASRLAATATAIAAGVERLGPGASGLVTGCAVLGTFRVVVTGGDPARVGALVDELRAEVAPLHGSVVVQSGPRAVRERVDPWGPVDPPVFHLMRGLKATFDPTRILNPGRFVGGL